MQDCLTFDPVGELRGLAPQPGSGARRSGSSSRCHAARVTNSRVVAMPAAPYVSASVRISRSLKPCCSSWLITSADGRRRRTQQCTPRPHHAEQAGEAAVVRQRVTLEEDAQAGSHAADRRVGLTSSVGSPQDLPGDREGSDHPTPARVIRDPLQVGALPYLIRLELAGRATSDHDSSLPARLLDLSRGAAGKDPLAVQISRLEQSCGCSGCQLRITGGSTLSVVRVVKRSYEEEASEMDCVRAASITDLSNYCAKSIDSRIS